MKIKSKIHPIEASAKKEASDFNIKNVLVALSGGADSVATLSALHKTGINIIALHCNFHLRNEESDRDTRFVENLCNLLNIKLQVIHFDVNNYLIQNKGTSVEMACRNLRHQWFDEKLAETGFDRIATGHNADDNIETFLLNMLRGSGSRGLRAMKADDGKIWRPLLSFHRKEILTYLSENHLDFVVDSTNLDSDYRRNFLRNKVIPLLKLEWKGFDKAMDKTIRNIESENLIVENVIDNLLPEPYKPLEVNRILTSPAPLLVIKRFIDPYGSFPTTPSEILSAIKANKPHIRRWRLKKGIVFLRNGNLFVEMSHGEGDA